VFLGSQRAARFVNRYIPWFTSPKRDLDDHERFFISVLDVSTAFVLLRLLGSTPLVPLLFDPLAAILPLRNKLAVSTVRWSQVVATTLVFTAFHEAERVSVSTFVSWLRSKRKESLGEDFKNVIIRGDERTRRRHDGDDEDEEEDSCIICAGEGTEPTTTLSDSISSLPTHSSNTTSSAGPLEEFCVHAPQKHPMHRACFLAWKDACWEDRTRAPAQPPLVALACDDESVPVPGTQQWARALAILRAAMFVPAQQVAFAPVGPDDWVGQPLSCIPLGQSMFTLHTTKGSGRDEFGGDGGSGAPAARDHHFGPLATMVSKWPSCPACRSVVKMTFATLPPPRKIRPTSFAGILIERYPTVRWAFKWAQTWKELVTGRTIFAKSLSQIVFVLVLVYAMKIRRPSKGRGLWLTRSLLPFMHIVSL